MSTTLSKNPVETAFLNFLQMALQEHMFYINHMSHKKRRCPPTLGYKAQQYKLAVINQLLLAISQPWTSVADHVYILAHEGWECAESRNRPTVRGEGWCRRAVNGERE